MKLVISLIFVFFAYLGTAQADFYPPLQQGYTNCRLEYTGNYYYVARNGSRLSELVANLSQADDKLRTLRYLQNCY